MDPDVYLQRSVEAFPLNAQLGAGAGPGNVISQH
jgi:hypothetical protein